MLTKTPTGRIPGTVMRLKIDLNLMRVVRANPAMYEMRPIADIAKNMCNRFVDVGFIDDSPENYGMTFKYAAGAESVASICYELSIFLFGKPREISCDVFDALCNVIILGDGDCPECGGELEFVETEGHKLNDGDYYTPDSYVVDKYVYECRNCGATIKSEIEL